MPSIKAKYGVPTALTVTGLGTLGDGASVLSNNIDRTALSGVNLMLGASFTTGSAAVAGSVIRLFAKFSLDGTTYSTDENDIPIGTVTVRTAGAQTLFKVFSIGSAFSGRISPSNVKVRVQQSTGAAFTAASLTYQSVFGQSVAAFTGPGLIGTSDWVAFGGGTTGNSSGTLTLTTTGGIQGARQQVTTTAGTEYVLSYDASSASNLLLGQTSGGTQYTAPGSSAIVWGVNGHPFWAYGGVTETNQMNLIAATGLRSYRIGMWDSWDAGALADAKRFFDMEVSKGVEILPLLNLHPEVYANDTAAYNAGFTYGSTFSSTYPGRLWECGNEYDNECIEDGADGKIASEYDDTLYARMSATIRGMIDGVRAGDSKALVGVGNAGWHHYGFQRRLWAEGVRWDYSIAHWYSDQGSITNVGGSGVNHLAILRDEFAKPILITEVNARPDSMVNTQAEIDWLINTMTDWNSIAATYDLRAVHIYELLDEPEAYPPGNPEAKYGLYSETGVIKAHGTAVKNKLIATPSANPFGTPASVGPNSLTFTATTTKTWVQVQRQASGTAVISDISLQET